MRPPEVFVRQLAPHEGQRLKRLSKTAKHQATRQRASILLASNTLLSVPQIARMWMTDESHVRKVIHDFNEHGFESLLERAYETFTEEARQRSIDYRVDVRAKPVIVSDGDRVLQIVGNLLSNAFKATPDGGRIALSLASPSTAKGRKTAS